MNTTNSMHNNNLNTSVATRETTHTTPHKSKGKQGLAGVLVFVNMLFFALTLALVSYLFDEWVEGVLGPTRIFSELNPAGRPALATMAMTFLSGAVGLATMIMAAVHAKNYSEGARFSSLGANLVSFALVCLAAGFSIKTLIKGHTGDKYVSIAITIAAFNILLVPTMLAYLMSLGLFKNKDEYATRHNNGVVYNNHATNSTVLPAHTQTKYVAGHETDRAMNA